MEANKKPRYTKEEDAIIYAAVAESPTNLHQAFIAASTKIDRTATSIEMRWYGYLSKNKKNPAFLVISKNGISTNKKNTNSISRIKRFIMKIWNDLTYKICHKLF